MNWCGVILVLILVIQNSILDDVGLRLGCYELRTKTKKKSVMGLYQHHLIMQEPALFTSRAGPSHAEDAAEIWDADVLLGILGRRSKLE